MEIIKYNIINKGIDKSKPYFDKNRESLVIRFKKAYNYYLIGNVYNPNKNEMEYYLLLGINKFNNTALKIKIDGFGKSHFPINGDILNYFINNREDNLNFDIVNTECNENYDVFQIV